MTPALDQSPLPRFIIEIWFLPMIRERSNLTLAEYNADKRTCQWVVTLHDWTCPGSCIMTLCTPALFTGVLLHWCPVIEFFVQEYLYTQITWNLWAVMLVYQWLRFHATNASVFLHSEVQWRVCGRANDDLVENHVTYVSKLHLMQIDWTGSRCRSADSCREGSQQH